MKSPLPLLPVDFCVVKRTGIVSYSLREFKDIPLRGGASLAHRIGLVFATATPILPISQAPQEPGTRPHRPMILVVAEEEFLILDGRGCDEHSSIFINVNVRGTLQWLNHPLSIGSPSPDHLSRLFRLTMSQAWSISMS